MQTPTNTLSQLTEKKKTKKNTQLKKTRISAKDLEYLWASQLMTRLTSEDHRPAAKMQSNTAAVVFQH